MVHADRHGALVIPSLVIPSLQHAIEKLIATERLVLDPASKPDFDFEAFARRGQRLRQPVPEHELSKGCAAARDIKGRTCRK